MKHETYERRLKSGARLIVVHVPSSPIFELETVVDSGFRFAPEGKHELPHLLEHLALEGSERYPNPQDFQYEIERFGIYHNAWTSIYKNGYVFYGAMEYLDRIVELAMEQLNHPIWRPDAITQQIEVVKNELTGKMDNARLLSGYNMYRDMKNGQVPDWPERIASVDRITRDDIVEFYKKYYQPANFAHIITGDLPANKVDELATVIEASQAHFSTSPQTPNKPILPEKPKALVRLVDYPHKETVSFSLNLFRPGFDEDRLIPMELFSSMLGGGFYSRLHQKVRNAGLGYSIGSGFSGGAEKGNLGIWDDPRSQHFIPLLKLALEEVMDLARGNFSDQELERARGYELGRHATRFQTALSITGWYATSYLDHLPIVSPEEEADILRSVTREQIVEAAQYYFAKDNPYRHLVVATQHGGQEELEKIIGEFGV